MPIREAIPGQRVLLNLPVFVPGSSNKAQFEGAAENGWRLGVAVAAQDADDPSQYIQIRDGSPQDGAVFAVERYGTGRGEWCLLDDAPADAYPVLPTDLLVSRLVRREQEVQLLLTIRAELGQYIEELEAELEVRNLQ